MIKYAFNAQINSLEIDPQCIEDGLTYAENNRLGSIRLRCLNQNSGEKYDIDFSAFSNKSFIKELRINDDFKIKKVSNLEHLKTLHNLRLLSFSDPKIKLDFSEFNQLEELYFKYNESVKKISALSNLKHLLITGLKENDLEILSGLKSLEILRLSGGSFTSLNGIETLNRIKQIKIDYQSKIQDISRINQLPQLSSLHIEKCKQLINYSFLKDNETIQELFIDNLDEIDFVPKMKNLNKLNFWNCKTGDLNPLIESKTLEQINFYPNKTHYSHTIDEINKITGTKRGVYK